MIGRPIGGPAVDRSLTKTMHNARCTDVCRRDRHSAARRRALSTAALTTSRISLGRAHLLATSLIREATRAGIPATSLTPRRAVSAGSRPTSATPRCWLAFRPPIIADVLTRFSTLPMVTGVLDRTHVDGSRQHDQGARHAVRGRARIRSAPASSGIPARARHTEQLRQRAERFGLTLRRWPAAARRRAAVARRPKRISTGISSSRSFRPSCAKAATKSRAADQAQPAGSGVHRRTSAATSTCTRPGATGATRWR